MGVIGQVADLVDREEAGPRIASKPVLECAGEWDGPGSLSYTVAGSSVPRSGSMTVAGIAFTVSQSAPAFTDDPLQAGVTIIKAVHITELRTRIDFLRERLGLGVFAWTNPALTGVFIQAVHITEMRTAFGQAYEEAGESQPTYTDPTLAPGVMMKAAHISELRASVAAIE